MFLRLLGAPWWVRWLVWSLFTALVVILIWGVAFPYVHNATDVGWALAAGLGLGAAVTLWQQPGHHAFVAAVSGLSGEEKSEAVRSLYGGEIPSDPEVLGAAMELAEVSAASRNPGRVMWVFRLMFLVSWAASAIGQIAMGEVIRGVVWAGLGLVVGASWAWDWRYLRRLRIRYDSLREAARPGTPRA
jgi:hypothetical protein